MDELEQQMNQAVESDPSAVEGAQDSIVQAEEPVQGGEQAQQELWQQDKRFGGVWKSADDVYKSNQYAEEKYQPYHTLANKHGFKDVDSFEEALNKYKEYSNPESDINQTYNYLQKLMEHETYGSEIQKTFSDIAKKMEQEKYGMNLPDEIKQRLDKVDAYEAKMQEQQFNETVSTYENDIQANIDKITQLCDKNGFEFDATDYLNDCQENNVDIANLYSHFVAENLDGILNNSNESAIAKALEQSGQNSRGVINSSSRNSSSNATNPSNYSELDNALLQQLQ